jgi:hypothetical protein
VFVEGTMTPIRVRRLMFTLSSPVRRRNRGRVYMFSAW